MMTCAKVPSSFTSTKLCIAGTLSIHGYLKLSIEKYAVRRVTLVICKQSTYTMQLVGWPGTMFKPA